MMTIGVQKECAIKEWLETRYMLSCILKHFISVRSNRPNFPWDKEAYKIHTQNTERDRLTETETGKQANSERVVGEREKEREREGLHAWFST